MSRTLGARGREGQVLSLPVLAGSVSPVAGALNVPSVVNVDNRSEAREFLASRRARLTPREVGLPAFGGNRRVAGLRREEVALLAGVSVDYYTRLERGNLRGVSESVLDGIAGALQLDEAERAHLFDLARTANATAGTRRRSSAQRVRPGVQRVLDAVVGAPAWIRNGRADIVATNALGRALYAPVLNSSFRPANTARFAFLDQRAHDFYLDWERTADEMVAVLRAEAGRNPYERGLTDLVGELSTRSEAFRTRWAAHDVRHHRTGRKNLHHPVVGDLHLTYEVMELTAEPGLTFIVYTAEPASPTQDALDLLASWMATVDVPAPA
jgi:transcriptional regulator with XRE-family HTH domain